MVVRISTVLFFLGIFHICFGKKCSISTTISAILVWKWVERALRGLLYIGGSICLLATRWSTPSVGLSRKGCTSLQRIIEISEGGYVSPSKNTILRLMARKNLRYLGSFTQTRSWCRWEADRMRTQVRIVISISLSNLQSRFCQEHNLFEGKLVVTMSEGKRLIYLWNLLPKFLRDSCQEIQHILMKGLKVFWVGTVHINLKSFSTLCLTCSPWTSKNRRFYWEKKWFFQEDFPRRTKGYRLQYKNRQSYQDLLLVMILLRWTTWTIYFYLPSPVPIIRNKGERKTIQRISYRWGGSIYRPRDIWRRRFEVQVKKSHRVGKTRSTHIYDFSLLLMDLNRLETQWLSQIA